MKISILIFLFSLPLVIIGQTEIQRFDTLDLQEFEAQSKNNIWLKMIDNGMSHAVYVPVIIVKGKNASPVLGLTAAIHGNELNGIKVIQEVIDQIDLNTFDGTIVAIPGLNAISIPRHQRRYVDEEDLNRNFPGKEKGNRSQQYVY